MPFARRETVDDTKIGTYHCMSRCVRRAFLCGDDSYTGDNYDHRKEWIRDRLIFLSEHFGVEILGYSVMSNHLHLVIRNRPDLCAEWLDGEVAGRWLRLFPRNYNLQGNAIDPKPEQVAQLLANSKKIQQCRERLGSISWFMRCLNEPIARRANQEDGCKGRFWEGRFESQALLDEGAILACMAYVDLNPVRAKVAKTPETSEYTSVHDRVKTVQARARVKLLSRKAKGRALTRRQKKLLQQERRATRAADWLTPFEDKPGSIKRGAVALSLEDYLQLLDWSGQMLRKDKPGALPAELAPVLDRLHVEEKNWIRTVSQFDSWFRRVAGTAAAMADFAACAGRNWFKGIRASREAFLAETSPASSSSGG